MDWNYRTTFNINDSQFNYDNMMGDGHAKNGEYVKAIEYYKKGQGQKETNLSSIIRLKNISIYVGKF